MKTNLELQLRHKIGTRLAAIARTEADLQLIKAEIEAELGLPYHQIPSSRILELDAIVSKWEEVHHKGELKHFQPPF